MSDKILFCRAAQVFTLSSLHSLIATGSLRNIPSPEQGASASIKSNCRPTALQYEATSEASLLVTSTRWFPHFKRFSFKGATLFLTISLATIYEFNGSIETRCVVLPPGAAHRSSTLG